MRTLVVTGGSRGIGAATARLAGTRGYSVCVNYRTHREAAETVVRDIEAWRAMHEQSYTSNWATIEGLHFLKDGTQTAGSAPDNDVVLIASLPEHLGTFTVASDEVTFAPAPGAALTINGEKKTVAAPATA